MTFTYSVLHTLPYVCTLTPFNTCSMATLTGNSGSYATRSSQPFKMPDLPPSGCSLSPLPAPSPPPPPAPSPPPRPLPLLLAPLSSDPPPEDVLGASLTPTLLLLLLLLLLQVLDLKQRRGRGRGAQILNSAGESEIASFLTCSAVDAFCCAGVVPVPC